MINHEEVKSCEAPKGVLHGKMGEYEEMNNITDDAIRQLIELVERFQGQSEEKMGQSPISPPVNGLIDGMDQLNRAHSENLKTIFLLVSKLKEII